MTTICKHAKTHFLKCSTTPFHRARHHLPKGHGIIHSGRNGCNARVLGSIIPGDSADGSSITWGSSSTWGNSRALSGSSAWGSGAWGGNAWGRSIWGGGVHHLSRVVGRRSACGCHFDKFPRSQQQALLALCTLAGIQISKHTESGQRRKKTNTQFAMM